ncbi:MAG: arsenate reductase [Saprospiraceae bacterium]|jgi:arsenate reductase|tara:strand:+ start:348 stop:707 length:360 start_codon:yes stop_codon:yes gene_type:complete
MKKVYYLKTCSTCNRIIKDLGLGADFEFQNIKAEAITPEQLDAMKEKVGSYEALFSRRSMKYKAWGLKEMELGEADYRKYILEEYTFLKRPVIWIGEEIFVGNTKKTVESASVVLGNIG